MPNTTSAKKRLRQNEVRRGQNRMIMSALKSQLRRVRDALSEGDVAKAEAEFKLAAKKLDRAGARRVIHPNTSARRKSRLQRMIKAAKQAGSSS